MHVAKRAVVLALVAFWSLAANHCKLEQVPGLQFLKCGESLDVGTHSDHDCRSDGCASVESGFYKTEEEQPATVALLVAEIPRSPIFLETISFVSEDCFVLPSVPPELSGRWQFVFRTASPPRAPSVAS